MNIPFVIDNQQHKMVEVLNRLLREHRGQSLDVATAYFNVGGWQLLREGLNGLGCFRLLLGDEPDTPRVVPADGEVDIFALQEKVIASIVQSSEEQVAIEEAPKLLDPIQQTIATTLRSYINNPTLNRKDIIAALQRLAEPQPGVYIKTLRKAYETFSSNGQIGELLAAVKSLDLATNGQSQSDGKASEASRDADSTKSTRPVRREDLKLICFDYIW